MFETHEAAPMPDEPQPAPEPEPASEWRELLEVGRAIQKDLAGILHVLRELALPDVAPRARKPKKKAARKRR